MSASAILMLVAAASLFALFASALAWAQSQAHRFTAVPIDQIAKNRPGRRRL
jgi:hypothetical protein